jgi:hypothetical protein
MYRQTPVEKFKRNVFGISKSFTKRQLIGVLPCNRKFVGYTSVLKLDYEVG